MSYLTLRKVIDLTRMVSDLMKVLLTRKRTALDLKQEKECLSFDEATTVPL